MSLTLARLKEKLDYDPVTGVFTHRISSRGTRAGTKAGTLRRDEYVQIVIDGKAYFAHILAWFYQTGEWPDSDIDHKDRRRFHNAFDNLRKATVSQNCANSNLPVNNTSGHKGVSFDKATGKWLAYIMVDYRQKALGRFLTKEAAADAYKRAAEKYFGEFANA